MPRRRDIFVIGLGALLVGVALLAGHPGVTVVTLTDHGFEPSSLTIRAGDTVRFVSTAGRYFWPASDPHPVHTDYSAFDPRRPIAPDDSWSFTFNVPGVWKFHDHLAAYYTGVVNVLAPGASVPTDRCASGLETISCWQEKLDAAYARGGLGAAFTEMDTLYSTDPEFPKNCHGVAHSLGLTGYRAYLANPSSVLDPKASACGNGFYHGFMEALLGTTGDIREAKKACEYIAENIGAASPDAALQCYHGIGHGIMETVVVNRASYGDVKEMADDGLGLCGEVSDSPEKLYRCSSGIFNALANWYISGTFGVSLKDDFFGICAREPDKFKLACYGNMNAAVMKRNDDSFLPAARETLAIPDAAYRGEALGYVAEIYAVQKLGPETYDEVAGECNALPSAYREICAKNFAQGLLEHGTPGHQYVNALAFCRASGLTTAEASACESGVAVSLPSWYSGDALAAACAQVDIRYQKLCHH